MHPDLYFRAYFISYIKRIVTIDYSSLLSILSVYNVLSIIYSAYYNNRAREQHAAFNEAKSGLHS